MSLSGKLCISLAQVLTLCTGCTIRAAVFDIIGRKSTEIPSVIFRFFHKTAWQESSNFHSDLRNSSSLEITKYYCVNCRCSAVTMPIRSNSYVTSSTSEQVVSAQLPMFFCHACESTQSRSFCDATVRQMQLLYWYYHNIATPTNLL